MTDAQRFHFSERFLAGQVDPDEFRTLTVDDARQLSYLLRQRRAQSRAQPRDAGSACDGSSADPGPGRSYSEREILAELGLE